MKKIFFYLLFFVKTLSFAQIINIPDINFKNKLINASLNNQTAGNTVIDLNGNGEIEENEASQVTYLFLAVSNISDLTGIEFFVNLQYLFVNVNLISNLNINQLTQLVVLRCDNNNLSTINYSSLVYLEQLNINNNNFTIFDFSETPNLRLLSCSNNQFTILNLSQNPLLTKLYCKNNNLTSINIKNGINEDFSNINYNDCWKIGNPNLTTICADASEVASVQSFLDGCGTAQAINITSNCGLSNDNFATNELVFFPNPTSSIITISSEEIIKSIELYDNLGRVLVSKKVNENQTLLDVSNYSNGVYFVKVVTDNGFKIEKVIKR